MRVHDTFKLATGNLKRTGRRTFLTILGIAVSVTFIILLVSIGFGLQELTLRKLVSIDALGTLMVTPEEGKPLDPRAKASIELISGVEIVSPEITLHAEMQFTDLGGNINSVAGTVVGVDTAHTELHRLTVSAGDGFTSANSEEVLVPIGGAAFGNDLDPERVVGRTLRIQVFGDEDSKALPKTLTLRIRGLLDEEDADASRAFVPIELLHNLYPEAPASSFSVRVLDRKDLERVSHEIAGLGYAVTSFAGLVKQVNDVFAIIRAVLGVVGGVSLFVATIGIVNTMTIALLERTREIGVMKALGASDGDVRALFLLESSLLGFWGGLWGVGSSIIIGNGLNFILRIVVEALGGPSEDFRIFITPAALIVLIFVFAFFVSLCAGIYPSHKAARLNPMEALRYE